MSTPTAPGPILGVVGGGQLGRMLAEAAAPLGVELLVLDPTPDAPAALVARDQIVGEFDDPEAVRELAERADLLTFEIELADPDLLEDVREETGTPVQPSPETLRTIQDKLVQKEFLRERNVPVPRYRPIDDVDDLHDALDEFGYPSMLKARRGGYDGRGNVPIESEADVEGAFEEIAGEAMLESFVDFERELSVIGVTGDGEVDAYDAVENVHEAEILRETVAPARAPADVLERARETASAVLGLLEGRGVYGIELFETGDGDVLVNEIAPRPHNSGHWTIEGAVTSQFEQHVRATLGWPLGSTRIRDATVTANLLGDVDESGPVRTSGLDRVLEAGRVHLHWYGKHEIRPLRKMGHLTVCADDGESRDELLEAARTYERSVTFRA